SPIRRGEGVRGWGEACGVECGSHAPAGASLPKPDGSAMRFSAMPRPYSHAICSSSWSAARACS
ncbi:MAG: hypothetical protein ACUVXG_09740, partial [Anaerolineae bacterium]